VSAAARVVPATGSYVARGAGDPPAYSVSATVKRRAGRTTISVQAGDRCHGFASFPQVRVVRGRDGAPAFSVEVGGARISGRWSNPTRIEGRVKTPCAKAQAYVLRLAA
jgi:hypothetical protein